MMKRISVSFDCDKCGSGFVVIVPNDANNDGYPTIFETVINSSDTAMSQGSHTYEDWGSHEGEHFGPCCWEEKSEEIFIEEIKTGKVTEAQLRHMDLLTDYCQYLPKQVASS